MEKEEQKGEEIKFKESTKDNQVQTENKKDYLSDLISIDKTIEELRSSGKLKDFLKRIDIDENGDFLNNRKHSYIFLFLIYFQASSTITIPNRL